MAERRAFLDIGAPIRSIRWQGCCINLRVVGVVFASGRRLILFDGKAALRLKPGVKVFDASGALLFQSDSEVLSVTLNGQQVATTSPRGSLQQQTDDLDWCYGGASILPPQRHAVGLASTSLHQSKPTNRGISRKPKGHCAKRLAVDRAV